MSNMNEYVSMSTKMQADDKVRTVTTFSHNWADLMRKVMDSNMDLLVEAFVKGVKVIWQDLLRKKGPDALRAHLDTMGLEYTIEEGIAVTGADPIAKAIKTATPEQRAEIAKMLALTQ